MSRRRLFGRKLDWFLIVAASFAALAIGALVGGAADLALLSLVIVVFALRGAHRAWRSEPR